jgi:YD repeat-containing protein
MKRIATLFLVLVVAQCAFSGVVKAQSPCVTGGLSIIGLFGFNCQGWGGGVGIFLCYGQTSNCAPAAAPIETCPTCPHGGQPISLSTGNTFIEHSDIRVPGLGNGLTLVRTWISQWPSTQMASQVGLFGPNWRSTYEERIFLGDDGYVRYARGDGSFWSFGLGGPGWAVAAPANAGATLVRVLNGSGQPLYWTLTLKSGEQRRFDINSGSLTAIIDRNGNSTTLTYDGTNRLVTVTDPASRTLTFTYPNGTSRLVTGISSSVGLSLTYSYDAQNRLSQVVKPDQTTVNFQYDTNSMITAVTDSDGKVLESHTYDSSHRGLTSSRANGVEALTITYQ